MIEQYSGIVALIISVITIVLSIRRAPFEQRKLDAEADRIHEEAADAAARRATSAEQRIDELRKIIAGQQEQITALQARLLQLEQADRDKARRITELETENGELRELVSKLTAQVAALGGIPVQPGDE